mgnify:CR=1 FL=1
MCTLTAESLFGARYNYKTFFTLIIEYVCDTFRLKAEDSSGSGEEDPEKLDLESPRPPPVRLTI